MRTHILLPAVLLLGAPLGAQLSDTGISREVRPFVGAYVPAGALRADFTSAPTVGGQGALELTRYFHIVGTVAWTRARTKLDVSDDVTHIWQYDLGVELNLVQPLAGGWRLRPFLGAGSGGRTYDFRAAELATRVCTSGYGAVGSELQSGAVALRLEGRDYLACYQQPLTGRQRTRNDVSVMAGVAYHLR